MPEKSIYVPQPGPLTRDDLELLVSSIVARSEKFPEENIALTIGLVLANIGDHFAPVTCVNGEWSGVKIQLKGTGGIPKCPNGHVLFQGEGPKLGWIMPVQEDDVDAISEEFTQ